MLDAYRALLRERDAWAQLPHDEADIWEHVLYHLRGAGDGHGVITLVTDLVYLAERCFRRVLEGHTGWVYGVAFLA